MQFILTIEDNECYGEKKGSITIDEIILETTEEIQRYSDYRIVWLNLAANSDFSTENLSEDKHRAFKLLAGNYTFRVQGLLDEEHYVDKQVSITQPDILVHTTRNFSAYSCDNNGFYQGRISGGTPPYQINIGIASTGIMRPGNYTINDLSPGTFEVEVRDNNNCLFIGDSGVIRDGTIKLDYEHIYSPTLYDGTGIVILTVSGYGPFAFNFEDTNNEDGSTFISHWESSRYLAKVVPELDYLSLTNNNFSAGGLGAINKTSAPIASPTSVGRKSYTYVFDMLYPGDYKLTVDSAVTTRLACAHESNFTIPNIQPIIVSTNIVADDQVLEPTTILTKDIYETLLIPYKHVTNNSTLWQIINSLSVNSSIYFNIDGTQTEFKVVRSMLSSNEILKLGNNENNWYSYLHVAPGILSIDKQIQLVNIHTKEMFDITLGLINGNIDSNNASLIRGSIVIGGTGEEFFEGSCIGVSVGETIGQNNISLEEISKNVVKNMYSPLSFDTTINYLQKLNKLIFNSDLSQEICDLYKNDFTYTQHIKELIQILNNPANYNNIYIYNISNMDHTGQINLNIDYQSVLEVPDNNNRNIPVTTENNISIDYFAFDNNTNSLCPITQDNQIISNVQSINGLNERYVLIKIQDKFNNKPKFLSFDNDIISYDEHYLSIKQSDLSFTSQITYGDILVYVGKQSNSLIPSIISDRNLPDPNDTPLTPVPTPINSINSITITTIPSDVKCIIYGPKNYSNTFSGTTTFNNLLPGVYTIMGDSEYLKNNSLYQNETRIIFNKDTIETVNIIFIDYKNKLLYCRANN